MSNGTQNPSGGLAGLGLWLAAGMVLSSFLAAHTFERVKSAGQTISVKGFAERRLMSDMAVWQGTVTARDPQLVAAYAKLEADMEKVRGYFEKNGVPRDALRVSSACTAVQHKRTDKGIETNEIEGYVLSQSVEINSTNVALVARLSRESTSLIRDGIEFSSMSPQYYYTRINDLKIELLGDATRDARQRAEQLARNSGGKVGELRGASQGVFQITPVFSTETSDYGAYDTSTVEKSIKAVVTIEYAIRR